MTTPTTYSWTLEEGSSGLSLGVDDEGNTILVDVGDVALELAALEGMDMVIRDDDIGFDLGLRTAVLLSLFVDRRAEEDDALPAADGDRHGWWADEFAQIEGDRIGSRLWLLDRSTQRSDLAKRVEEIVREGLAWMLEDKVTDRIDVLVQQVPQQLFVTITLARPTGKPVAFRFGHVWDGEARHP